MNRKRVVWFVAAGQVLLGAGIACSVTPSEDAKKSANALTAVCGPSKRLVEEDGPRCTYRLTSAPSGSAARPTVRVINALMADNRGAQWAPPVDANTDADWACQVSLPGCGFEGDPNPCTSPLESPNPESSCPSPPEGWVWLAFAGATARETLEGDPPRDAVLVRRGKRADIQRACEDRLATLTTTAAATEDLALTICDRTRARAEALSGRKLCCASVPHDSGYGPVRDASSDRDGDAVATTCPPGYEMHLEQGELCSHRVVGASFDSEPFGGIPPRDASASDAASSTDASSASSAPRIRARVGPPAFTDGQTMFRCDVSVTCNIGAQELQCKTGIPASGGAARCAPGGSMTHWWNMEPYELDVSVRNRANGQPDPDAALAACAQKFEDQRQIFLQQGNLTIWERSVAMGACNDLLESMPDSTGQLACCVPITPPPPPSTPPSGTPSTPPSGTPSTPPSGTPTAPPSGTPTAPPTAAPTSTSSTASTLTFR